MPEQLVEVTIRPIIKLSLRAAGPAEGPPRSKPKAHRVDEVQLCAQAICLEEMFETAIADGALFYGETRRRCPVRFDADLRALTTRVAGEARAMLAAGRTPPPVRTPKCRRCSLADACQPDRLERPPSVHRWLAGQLHSLD